SLEMQHTLGDFADKLPMNIQYSQSGLIFIVVTCVLCMILKFIAVKLAQYTGTKASEQVKITLRQRLYQKILDLGPSYKQQLRTADLVQISGEGIEQAQTFYELFLPQVIYSIIAPITLFFVVLPINAICATVLLVLSPMVLVIVGLVAKSALKIFRKYWGKYTDMGALFLDNVQGLQELRNFDADERAAEEMDDVAQEFRIMTMRVLQIELRSLAAMDIVSYVGAAAGILVAVWQMSAGLNLGNALFIVLLALQFFLPFRQLGSFFHVAANGVTALKKIYSILDLPATQQGDITIPADSSLRIVLNNLSYSYDENSTHSAFDDKSKENNRDEVQTSARENNMVSNMPPAPPAHFMKQGSADNSQVVTNGVHNISLNIEPNTITAIVGVSGSGKSTLANIISGSIQGYNGSCKLEYFDGTGQLNTVEYADLMNASLVQNISFVGAQSHIFNGTIRDNLLIANPDARDEDLWHALEQAHIDQFVRELPEGLDTRIVSGGTNLSGGQRQRLAIARVLLRNSSVYVFDEATSSVDSQSEELIMRTIRALAQRATVVVISHRLANVVNANNIIVMQASRVVEQGTHDVLMQHNSVYAHMYQTQSALESVIASSSSTVDDQSADLDSATQLVQESQEHSSKDSVEDEKDVSNKSLLQRLLREVSPLSKYLVGASVIGIIGHITATFMIVFGAAAVLSRTDLLPHQSISTAVYVVLLCICAVLRGCTRYVEQYLNHNVAFRLLALLRAKVF
ncbi:MAG: ABC transporter ATP-binding protein/permease, partial [Bifidobacteriaceae bacterium]|nr:ABC transporter ATP-binding protein/permease [Bifidobacteriaceae bacterium]